MFDRLRRRKHRSTASTRPQSIAEQPIEARTEELTEEKAKELAAAWNALDDATRDDILAAAQELQDVYDRYKIKSFRACYRAGSPPSTGKGWRTAEDLRSEAAFIRELLADDTPH